MSRSYRQLSPRQLTALKDVTHALAAHCMHAPRPTRAARSYYDSRLAYYQRCVVWIDRARFGARRGDYP